VTAPLLSTKPVQGDRRPIPTQHCTPVTRFARTGRGATLVKLKKIATGWQKLRSRLLRQSADSSGHGMLRSTPQTGSFAKIAHRAIFKRSALAGAGTLTRFGFSAPSLHSLSNAYTLYCRAVRLNL
jgi:hypothetical protein